MFDNTDNISLLTRSMKFYLEIMYFLPKKEIKVENNVSKKRNKDKKYLLKKKNDTKEIKRELKKIKKLKKVYE